MTDDEIKAALERAEKATAGPWLDDHWDDPTRYHIIWIGAEVIGEIGHHARTVKERVVANADFVTHARSDVPALAQDLLDTRAALRELCAELLENHIGTAQSLARSALLATPDPEARR